MDREARPRVVVVEDDRDVATLVTEVLNDEGFDAVTADQHASVAEVTGLEPRLLIVDLFLGRSTAHGFLAAFRAGAVGRVPVIVLSAAHDGEVQARSLGANAFVHKPFDIDELVRTCRDLAA